MDDIDKREAELLARLEAEREQRVAEKIAAGQIVSVPLYIVAGSHAEARTRVEAAKTDKLAELHDSGHRREVVFDVTMVVTGVVQHGEAADPGTCAPSAPSFASEEDDPSLTTDAALESQDKTSVPTDAALKSQDNEPPPPVIETYVCVQTRQCRDDGDAGEVAEGWWSIDDSVLTVTDANGKYVGSRAMLEGEDTRVVAKQLLRGKKAPEEEFNRPLSYPNAGLA
jgi:hypothetical protein